MWPAQSKYFVHKKEFFFQLFMQTRILEFI